MIPFTALLLAALGLAAPPDAAAEAKIPLLHSTDLLHPHDDPDDHYDLATVFAMPEFDLRGVVLDLGERQAQRPGRRRSSRCCTSPAARRRMPWA